MASSLPDGCCGITRRGFLAGTAVGVAAGVPLTWFGSRLLQGIHGDAASAFSGRRVEVERPAQAMPGRFPGSVVEVHHPDSVASDFTVDGEAVRTMVDRGMTELTGADGPEDAWKTFFVIVQPTESREGAGRP